MSPELRRTHAARTNKAFARVEGKIRIAGVSFCIEVIFAFETITDFPETYGTRHVLQFTIAICGASQAVQWMIRDIQLHDIASQLGERVRLCVDLHAILDQRCAGCGVTLAALDFDQTQAAGTKWCHVVGRTKFRHIHTRLTRGAHDGGAGVHGGRQAVYLDGYGLYEWTGRRAKISGSVVGFIY